MNRIQQMEMATQKKMNNSLFSKNQLLNKKVQDMTELIESLIQRIEKLEDKQ